MKSVILCYFTIRILFFQSNTNIRIPCFI